MPVTAATAKAGVALLVNKLLKKYEAILVSEDLILCCDCFFVVIRSTANLIIKVLFSRP